MEYQIANYQSQAKKSISRPDSPIENRFLDDVLVDKIKALQDTIKHLEGQIANRREIRDYNIHRILLDSCYTGTKLLNLPLDPFDRDISKQRTTLEQQLGRLEKEKRDEDTALWKDVQLLYKDLAEAKREYQAIINRTRSIVPKRFYSVLKLDRKLREEAKPDENSPDFEKMVKTTLTRMP